jgi:hypothetical protein
MKQIFRLMFDTSEYDGEFNSTSRLTIATEKQVINEIIPQMEKDFEVNADRGKIYDRKISYAVVKSIYGHDGKEYELSFKEMKS